MDIKLTPTTLAKLSKAIGGHPLSFIAAQTDGANRWYYTHEFRSPSEAILVMNAFRRTLDRSVYNALETTALFLVLGEGEGRVVIQTPFFVKKTSQKNGPREAKRIERPGRQASSSFSLSSPRPPRASRLATSTPKSRLSVRHLSSEAGRYSTDSSRRWRGIWAPVLRSGIARNSRRSGLDSAR